MISILSLLGPLARVVHVRKFKYYNSLVPKAGCYVVIVLSAQTILILGLRHYST